MTEAISGRDSHGRRREVLRALRAAPDPMSILALTDKLDNVHPNTVRFHLDILVGDGVVELVEPDRKGPGRPPLMFRAVRQMDRGGTRHYQLLAEVLTKALASEKHPRAKALAAGRGWSSSLTNLEPGLEPPALFDTADEAIDCLVDVLDELGFAPERRESENEEQQVGMRHCPFLELAENQTDVICQLHLGVIQGVLEARRAPISAQRLDPLVTPDLCLLHLKLTSADESAGSLQPDSR